MKKPKKGADWISNQHMLKLGNLGREEKRKGGGNFCLILGKYIHHIYTHNSKTKKKNELTHTTARAREICLENEVDAHKAEN